MRQLENFIPGGKLFVQIMEMIPLLVLTFSDVEYR